ncbi:hypothetical protein HETIRDRAFT_173548 [Heterobasidion irregulare TC 32-1]|uniref:Uncharacterized protein n=1 Tax=Heterobasidion irregulare (strain TC 32-1) TaxID=747525 RepID=W4K7Z2_HETIT|nr:uncharacterized protein HETIRDRAFT_173548 [Heterobasidion irregulare TC 32-1]ETW81864.1 hypothetical protein HETIRDRAFT_173548 [Heterobasidion irregulare TC 32-1]
MRRERCQVYYYHWTGVRFGINKKSIVPQHFCFMASEFLHYLRNFFPHHTVTSVHSGSECDTTWGHSC